ncbi:hypothetical protein KI688_004343 [Linnemannia hyalina]|uniref:RNase H type-1 domain-containing protein n=1 Tax=Linnemannia hyalina TaxID=64524 RepID=A0A9P8BP40_9FUNG|nr:hypothetical protein KI688_004343 [Linnemannia hyalina]
MRAFQDTPVDNSNPRVLYSGGPLLDSGTPEMSQAFGVVDLTQDNPLTVQGRTDGHASSAKAELMGLLAAVLSAPPEQDIVVKLDNQSVVEQYNRLVKNRRYTFTEEAIQEYICEYLGGALAGYGISARRGRGGKRVKRVISDIDDVEWTSALAYVHDRHAVFTFYSTSKNSHQWIHHIKKLHGILPTLNSMQARKPNLYPTCVCRRCELEKEDNDHVWKCPLAAETTTEIWKEAMGKINEWGVQATNSYNAARKR